MIVDQTDWAKLRVTGADRVRFLQGMVTNDVATLEPGEFCRAALLTVKGRVLAILDIVQEGQSVLLLSEPGTGDKVRQTLERHAIADDVAFAPVDAPLHRVWSSLSAVWTAPPVLEPPPGAPVPAAEVEIRRVEAGLPRYGVDVTEDHFPFEANLDSVISYTKGCYIGQEVVARANARGHANKRLVGLRLMGEGPVAAGAAIAAAARADAGLVTSSVVSPTFGPIALAYVHRTVWEPGTEVTVGGRRAAVSALPFTA